MRFFSRKRESQPRYRRTPIADVAVGDYINGIGIIVSKYYQGNNLYSLWDKRGKLFFIGKDESVLVLIRD